MNSEYSINEQKALLEKMLEQKCPLYYPKEEREIAIIKDCLKPLELVRYLIGDDGMMIALPSTDYANKFLELNCFKYIEEIEDLKRKVSELKEDNLRYKKHWLVKLLIKI